MAHEELIHRNWRDYTDEELKIAKDGRKGAHSSLKDTLQREPTLDIEEVEKAMCQGKLGRGFVLVFVSLGQS